MTKLVDVKGASELLGVSDKKVWKLVYSRELDSVRIGRCVRIPIPSIEALILSNTTPARVA